MVRWRATCRLERQGLGLIVERMRGPDGRWLKAVLAEVTYDAVGRPSRLRIVHLRQHGEVADGKKYIVCWIRVGGNSGPVRPR